MNGRRGCGRGSGREGIEGETGADGLRCWG